MNEFKAGWKYFWNAWDHKPLFILGFWVALIVLEIFADGVAATTWWALGWP
jgi:hypothetical protein